MVCLQVLQLQEHAAKPGSSDAIMAFARAAAIAKESGALVVESLWRLHAARVHTLLGHADQASAAAAAKQVKHGEPITEDARLHGHADAPAEQTEKLEQVERFCFHPGTARDAEAQGVMYKRCVLVRLRQHTISRELRGSCSTPDPLVRLDGCCCSPASPYPVLALFTAAHNSAALFVQVGTVARQQSGCGVTYTTASTAQLLSSTQSELNLKQSAACATALLQRWQTLLRHCSG